MPIIQCDIREGRSEAQKRALAREITRVVHETIDAPLEYIYVLIRETPGFNHVKAGHHLPDFVPAPARSRRPRAGPARARTRAAPRRR
jgi:4-oxalocrotonate tautomerase